MQQQLTDVAEFGARIAREGSDFRAAARLFELARVVDTELHGAESAAVAGVHNEVGLLLGDQVRGFGEGTAVAFQCITSQTRPQPVREVQQ